jgi:hypothetical protein
MAKSQKHFIFSFPRWRGTLAKNAADTIERGDLFTAFRDEPEKHNRLCNLADALQKP